MKLEGYNKYHKRVEVRISDCPIRVNKTFTVLAGVRNSVFIFADSIVRKDEETGIAEGDFVYDAKSKTLLGIVIYNKVFLVQNKDGGVEKLVLGEHILMKKGSEDSCIKAVTSPNRQAIRFSYKGTSFPVDILLSKDGDSIIMFDVKERVDPNQILIDTGFMLNDTTVGFGSLWNGGEIALKNLEPGVLYENGDFEKLEIL